MAGTAVVLVGCQGIFDAIEPWIGPVYDENDEVLWGFGGGGKLQFGPEFPITLWLTTQIATPTSREYVLTCEGGPADEETWTFSTAAKAKALISVVAAETYLILPETQSEIDDLFEAMGDAIDLTWISTDDYYFLTGR